MTNEKLFTWVSRRHCGYYEFEVMWIIYIILGKPNFWFRGWMENGERTENFERWEAHWEYDLLNGTNCRIEDI